MLIRIQLVLCLALMVGTTSSCQNVGENCIYLIPKNFEGNVLIIYEDQMGVDTMYEGKSRVYKFDTTGILKTKFGPNYGVQKNFYYYIDSVGKRFQINYAIPSQLKGTDEVVIYNQETGNDIDKKKSTRRHFEMFTVAKQNDIKYIANLRDSFMWKNLDQ